MNDSVLRTFLRILAYLSYWHEGTTHTDWIEPVCLYLRKFNLRQTREEIISAFNLSIEETNKNLLHSSEVSLKEAEKILCLDVEKNMLNHEKVLLYILLIEFIEFNTGNDDKLLQRIESLTTTCNVPGSNTRQLKEFIHEKNAEKLEKVADLIITGEKKDDITQELEGAWIEENRPKDLAGANILEDNELQGNLFLIYEKNINAILFKYMGDPSLTINKLPIEINQIYIIRNKDKILKNNHLLFSYKELSEYFIQTTQDQIIVFSGNNISLSTKAKKRILHPFTFSERSGSIVGILGDKNSGKEALVELLSGLKKPSSGHITINDSNILKNKHKLLGLVAEIPKEPVLIEGLTIYENYYYFARLYFRYLDKKKIQEKIFTVLNKLGLQNLKSLKWQANELSEISSLQIKLLNLGIGLLKDPAVIILKEPFSDLSTLDIQELFTHFRELSMKGKLLFISSTPPYLFNLKEYDKLWIFDQGGYPIYNGKPENSISYFQSLSERLPANKIIPYPAEIWQIIKANITDKHGEKTRERKIKPAQWYEFYKQHIEKQISFFDFKNILPYNTVRIPDIDKQFLIHFIKDIFLFTRKTTKKNISIIIIAIVGLTLGFLFRFSSGNSYSFHMNSGLVSFFTALNILVFVLGIYHGRNILKYDKLSFFAIQALDLNSAAFFTPKIILEGAWLVLMVVVSTVIPYLIINDINSYLPHLLIYILVAFTGFVFGVLLVAVNNKHTSYTIILVVILFQLFFGNTLFINQQLSYDKRSGNPVYEIASLSFLRWSQEALCVDQLINNQYAKIFFPHERELTRSEMYNNSLMPLLFNHLDSANHAMHQETNTDEARIHFTILANELNEITKRFDIFPFEYIDALNTINFTEEIASECRDYLTYLQFHFYELRLMKAQRISEIKDSLTSNYGPDYLTQLKNEGYNLPLFRIINQPEMNEKITLINDSYHFNNYPLYVKSLNEFGRAHFFASSKLFNNQYIPTYWFNVVMLLLGIVFLYSLIMAEVPYYLAKRFN